MSISIIPFTGRLWPHVVHFFPLTVFVVLDKSFPNQILNEASYNTSKQYFQAS